VRVERELERLGARTRRTERRAQISEERVVRDERRIRKRSVAPTVALSTLRH
jgi:hypothetical protein